MMTVGELKKELELFDDDTVVVLSSKGIYDYDSIKGVYEVCVEVDDIGGFSDTTRSTQKTETVLLIYR